MNIFKTCLKAGHRWGRAIRAERRGWWVEIRQCQRQGCRRLRADASGWPMFTYDLMEGGQVVNRKVIRK